MIGLNLQGQILHRPEERARSLVENKIYHTYISAGDCSKLISRINDKDFARNNGVSLVSSHTEHKGSDTTYHFLDSTVNLFDYYDGDHIFGISVFSPESVSPEIRAREFLKLGEL